MPKLNDELTEQPKTADETAALIDRLLSRAATLQKENAEQFKADFLAKLESALKVYERIAPDARSVMYATPEFKTVLSGLNLGWQFKPTAIGVTKDGPKGTRAKRFPEANALAYLASEHTEAEFAEFTKYKLNSAQGYLERLKTRKKADFNEVGGVKKWKALPAAKK